MQGRSASQVASAQSMCGKKGSVSKPGTHQNKVPAQEGQVAQQGGKEKGILWRRVPLLSLSLSLCVSLTKRTGSLMFVP